MLQHLYNLFQIELVRLIEGVEVLAVDVKDSDDLVVTDDWNDDFAVGSGGTRNMSGEVMDVRHDDGFGALPSCAADTFTIRNARGTDPRPVVALLCDRTLSTKSRKRRAGLLPRSPCWQSDLILRRLAIRSAGAGIGISRFCSFSTD